MTTAKLTAGSALFARLKQLGIDYVFANSGTDFPPIIEGLAQVTHKQMDLPVPLLVPHEHAAVGMAHGYYFATGKAQAVMLHTNVGLSNGATGVINAATDHVPMMLMSGRTPTTERGRFGSRTVPIGWGQEMRDQTALVREACKWDYELRFAEQMPELLDRAFAIANSTPRGPVYLSLPREVLAESCPAQAMESRISMRASTSGATPDALERAAEMLANAQQPLIFAQRGCGDARGFAALQRIADAWGWPVCNYWACQLPVASDHPMNIGPDPLPFIEQADVILVIDSLAPWMPQIHQPQTTTPVIQLGPDPLESRFPVRQFASDISLATDTAEGLIALENALSSYIDARQTARQRQRAEIVDVVLQRREHARLTALAGAQGAMTKAYVAHCVSAAIAGRAATVLSELGAPLEFMTLSDERAWYQEPHSGGLGWSLPCAMGMRLADSRRLVIATMGDGSYMFANPTVCHQVMEAHHLAVLIIVLNNEGYGAVSQAVTGLYPDGDAARADHVPLTRVSPSPDFTLTAKASRAYAQRVDDSGDLPGALEKAIAVIDNENRSALLDVAIA